ncbi:hypothetical protein J2S25_003889 [Mesobacillus stamsii]|uniref:Uncharacterized protein n=1 Tax=Mesobacillus stamsii TaxID=225347 RepID=A0ABU0G274_9BACI|nr:hypothetical protein [Mesobacillus stamsii]
MWMEPLLGRDTGTGEGHRDRYLVPPFFYNWCGMVVRFEGMEAWAVGVGWLGGVRMNKQKSAWAMCLGGFFVIGLF